MLVHDTKVHISLGYVMDVWKMFQSEGFNEIQGEIFLSFDKFFLPIYTEITNGILYI
jgi:hypothetical protein